MPGIILLGLGPGNPAQLTREAWDLLTTADEIWLRTRLHPTVGSLPESVKLHSFDDMFENGASLEDVHATVTKKILELGRRPQGVIYAVPGHPFVAEATCPEIDRLARTEGLDVRVVEALSFLEPTFSALGLDPYPRLSLCDSLELSTSHVPPFQPDVPALVAQIYSRLVASEVKGSLSAVYPDEHPVRLVHAAGTAEQVVEDLPLFEIDHSPHIGHLTTLYVPPLGEGTSFEKFQETIAHLRAPDGCPWDREQTHQTLRTHLIEEAYEALDALDQADPSKMCEEFGDVLLQIVLHAQIASEEGEFTMADIIQGIYQKLIRRHPHVFGDVQVDGVGKVLANWETIKQAERDARGESEKSLLDGVPLALPALNQAQEYQDRAARVGFDWPEIEGVLDKIVEEIQEVRQANDNVELTAEMGDLFFALVNLARWKKIDAESALRETNLKFKRRFAHVEQGARQQNRALADLSLDEMDAFWNEAKRQEK
jgi:tetrapyrrole methylase family protein/MazG family protein